MKLYKNQTLKLYMNVEIALVLADTLACFIVGRFWLFKTVYDTGI